MCSQYIGSNTGTATFSMASRNLPSPEDVELLNAVLDICKESAKWRPHHDLIASRGAAKLRATCPPELLGQAQARLEQQRASEQLGALPTLVFGAQAPGPLVAPVAEPVVAQPQPSPATVQARAELLQSLQPQPGAAEAAMFAEAMAQLGAKQGPTASPSGKSPKSSKTRFQREALELLQDISRDFVLLDGKQLFYYHIATGTPLGKESFIGFCEDEYGSVGKYDDQDNLIASISAGEAWIKHNDPRFPKRSVLGIDMRPTSLSPAEDAAQNRHYYNRWHQLKETMVTPDPRGSIDNCAIIINHLMYLSDGDSEGVMYFLNWLAQLYQTPEIKIPTAIMFYSKFGQIGKTSLHKLLSKVFGEPLTANLNGKVLAKQFWDALEHKRIVMLNELARSDKQDTYEWFKNLISERQISLEGKGKTEREVRNFMHFVITTNNLDALPLMQEDPRILVMKCESRRKDDEYYVRLHQWLDGEGPALFAGLLANWPFPKDWNPYAPVPQTTASKAAQQAARSPLVVWLEELSEAREAPFDKDLVRTGSIIEQLNALYPAQAKSMRLNTTTVGKALRELGYVELKSGNSSKDRYLCRPDRVEFWIDKGPTAWKIYFNAGPQEAQRLAAEPSIEPNVTRH